MIKKFESFIESNRYNDDNYVRFMKEPNGDVFCYYPKRSFRSEAGEKSYAASNIEAVRGNSVTDDYIAKCTVASKEESQELLNLIKSENIELKWSDFKDDE